MSNVDVQVFILDTINLSLGNIASVNRMKRDGEHFPSKVYGFLRLVSAWKLNQA